MLRSDADDRSHAVNAPPIVEAVLRSGGQPLAPTARATMESLFGEDFSQVRVQTDDKAAQSARAIGARAYTEGADVVFDSGQAPDVVLEATYGWVRREGARVKWEAPEVRLMSKV